MPATCKYGYISSILQSRQSLEEDREKSLNPPSVHLHSETILKWGQRMCLQSTSFGNSLWHPFERANRLTETVWKYVFKKSNSPVLSTWKSPYSSPTKGKIKRRHLALTIPGNPTAELFSRQQVSSSADQKLSCKVLLTLQQGMSPCFSPFSMIFIHYQRKPERQAPEGKLALKQRDPESLNW